MPKSAKSDFPGSLRDRKEAANAEGEKVSAKIDAAFTKLAKKMRERADKPKAKIDGTKKPEKRAVLLRRFELYANAATHLEAQFKDRMDRDRSSRCARSSSGAVPGQTPW